jgi:hypothetical protein
MDNHGDFANAVKDLAISTGDGMPNNYVTRSIETR